MEPFLFKPAHCPMSPLSPAGLFFLTESSTQKEKKKKKMSLLEHLAKDVFHYIISKTDE
jgi:hypothetical protein